MKMLSPTDLKTILHSKRANIYYLEHCRVLVNSGRVEYSSLPPTDKWQDAKYMVYANTDRKSKTLSQQLDEHNIGVGQNAFLLAKMLPKLRQNLPAITRHKDFKRRSQNEKFSWQDKSYELACSVRDKAKKFGFFGVNMASTGCDKTFANARIMYGLADEKVGCRFSIALGLRTLTLQIGDALQERLHLQQEDLAVLIGSQAVLRLHEKGKTENEIGKALFIAIQRSLPHRQLRKPNSTSGSGMTIIICENSKNNNQQ